MNEKVFVTENGIIEILVIGDQTVDSIRELGDEATRVSRSVRVGGQPVLVLDNLMEIGNVPPAGRRLVVEFIKTVEYDRLAMLGTNPLIRFGANLMFRASGKGHLLKFFDDRVAAEQWLKNSKSS